MQNIQIPPFDEASAKEAKRILNSLAKVANSLGIMEDLAVQLAGIQGNPRPTFLKKAHIIFAGDHGIANKGISSTGQEITIMQTKNFLRGGATINAYCRTAGAELTVVDVGIAKPIDDEKLVKCNIVRSTKDFSEGPAMTKEEALACIQVGIDQAREKASQGFQLLSIGEMGIGNTSPSSAIVALMTGSTVREVTGIGSGISKELVEKKIALIEQGIALNAPNPLDALDVLAKVGGAEIAAMVGLILGGASLRIPIILDGFIAGAAAIIAINLYPECKNMLIASHISKEAGHRVLLDYLNLQSYLDLGLRLGEGTGAVLLLPLIDSAVRVLHEMISLEELLAINT